MLDDTAPPSFVPLLRTLTLPADANLNGGIFGGWILSQMDKAAGLLGMRRSAGSCTTVAIENLKFLAPLHSGEEFSIYGEVLSAGRTSLKLRLEGRAADPAGGPERVIIDAFFVVVALDAEGRPRPLSGTPPL